MVNTYITLIFLKLCFFWVSASNRIWLQILHFVILTIYHFSELSSVFKWSSIRICCFKSCILLLYFYYSRWYFSIPAVSLNTEHLKSWRLKMETEQGAVCVLLLMLDYWVQVHFHQNNPNQFSIIQRPVIHNNSQLNIL